MADIEFDFDYSVREPGPPLQQLVTSIWYARGTIPYAREKIAPTGSPVAILILGDPIMETPDNGFGVPITSDRGLLVGPHDRPLVNEPLGETYAVGIVGTAVSCEALFGIPPSQIRGQVVELSSVWPTTEPLREALLAAVDPDEMLELVEQTLLADVELPLPELDRVETVVELLEADPLRKIADIAAAVGITHGHLNREFTRVVGLAPRSLARLLRMQRLLGDLDVRIDSPWTELAARFGWFDQAHLIRDFKRHTGATPTEYVTAQRAAYNPSEAGEGAGFVPEQ